MTPLTATGNFQKAKANMRIKLGKHITTSFDYKFMLNINTI